MRALAVHLPWLAADRALAREPGLAGRALVLTETRRARRVVVATSPEAEAAGVRAGDPLSEAAVRVADLCAREHDPTGDGAALLDLARGPLLALSPRVALADARTIVVDLAGTERLHGDEVALLARVRATLAALAWRPRLAVADALATAAALATSGEEPVQRVAPGADAAATLAAVASLPPEALGLERETLRRLRALGIERVAELHALPRAALPARLGDALLARLDEVLGRRERVLTWLAPTPTFAARRGFGEGGVTRREAWLAAADELTDELCAQLAQAERSCARLELEVELEPPALRGASRDAEGDPAEDGAALGGAGREGAGREGTGREGTGKRPRGAPLLLELALAAPSRSAPFLRGLLRERLERVHLGDERRPALSITLRARASAPARAEQSGLFARAPAQRGARELAELLTRLELELGPRRVVELAFAPDPRPERARAFRPASALLRRPARAPQRAPAPAPEQPEDLADVEEAPLRPLRLFARPRPLVVRSGPEGPREVLEEGRWWEVAARRGPERVETGWWEEALRRDYWVLSDAGGRAVWVFHDLARGAFFLHGLFD